MNFKDNPIEYLETIIYIETEQGSGTGFVFHPDGYAITCAHVIRNANEIYARIGTQKDAIEKACIVNVYQENDLAIIQLEGKQHFSAELAPDAQLQIGAEISILGFPFGSKVADDVMSMSVSLTRGYVSSIQTQRGQKRALLDISAKAGNSGSPVIDRHTGAVIGVLAGSILGGTNNREEVNYMIPLSYIYAMLTD